MAEEVGIKMAIHPDDPPVSVFGLPRIVKNESDLEKIAAMVDSPSNGFTIVQDHWAQIVRMTFPISFVNLER